MERVQIHSDLSPTQATVSVRTPAKLPTNQAGLEGDIPLGLPRMSSWEKKVTGTLRVGGIDTLAAGFCMQHCTERGSPHPRLDMEG